MQNAVLVFGDEAIWDGNKKSIGKLKAMVTEENAMIEPKGRDLIPVKNFRHFILASNEDLPVHLDPDDRRFLVLKVCEEHKEDFPYFKKIDSELKDGGYEALLYDLLQTDITDFNPKALPTNIEAFEIKMLSASSSVKYIYEALCAGCFDIGNATTTECWRQEKPTNSVFNDYTAWCFKENLKPQGSELLGKALKKRIPSSDKQRLRVEGKKTQTYVFPSLDRARADFQKSFKADSSIW